jgi:hypothetical protein
MTNAPRSLFSFVRSFAAGRFAFLRRVAARRVATPWWNLRFSLGMWIGGFNHARRDYPQRKETA